MPAPGKCRFAIHLGLGSLSYVRIERSGDRWCVADTGEIPWHSLDKSDSANEQQLDGVIRQLAHQQGVSREPIHVSLHSRYCVSRVVTGSRQQVEDQLEEISANSQHYLQFGLGEKLIGKSNVQISDSQQYGQVAIIKRGLIETIDKAVSRASLSMTSVDGAMPNICRLVGFAGLDQRPLLVVWIGKNSAEIGISYQGRLQLTYQLGGDSSVDAVASTICTHLKRLRRFCDRYRSVDSSANLQDALIMAPEGDSQLLRDKLEGSAFERVFTLEDLSASRMRAHLPETPITFSPGAVSALGGLLVQLDKDVLPTTNLLDNYLYLKPRTWTGALLQDGWPPMLTAAILLLIFSANLWLDHKLKKFESETQAFEIDHVTERQSQLELEVARQELRNMQELQRSIWQVPEKELLASVASCLSEDTRVDSLTIDAQAKMVLKGTMVYGDQTYDLLKSLRALPAVVEVALESVSRSSNFGQSSTTFEIHCQLVKEPIEKFLSGEQQLASAPTTRSEK
jgi:hypothetical protein